MPTALRIEKEHQRGLGICQGFAWRYVDRGRGRAGDRRHVALQSGKPEVGGQTKLPAVFRPDGQRGGVKEYRRQENQ